jgi:hypothetical protein
MGLRERTLTLPVMVALVLSMIWRQIGSIFDLTRIVQQETLLWVKPKPDRQGDCITIAYFAIRSVLACVV